MPGGVRCSRGACRRRAPVGSVPGFGVIRGSAVDTQSRRSDSVRLDWPLEGQHWVVRRQPRREAERSMTARKRPVTNERRHPIGRDGTATVPLLAMLSGCPLARGHGGKLRRYVHDADSVQRTHFRGLNDPFGDRLHPCFRRGRGRGCRKGNCVVTLSTPSEHSRTGSRRSAMRLTTVIAIGSPTTSGQPWAEDGHAPIELRCSIASEQRGAARPNWMDFLRSTARADYLVRSPTR